jgi:hypothetical protein
LYYTFEKNTKEYFNFYQDKGASPLKPPRRGFVLSSGERSGIAEKCSGIVENVVE